MNNLTTSQITDLNNINKNTQNMNFGIMVNEVVESLNNLTIEGTPVNAVNASQTLNISGVVVHGETVIINNPAISGSDVYEFLADDEQSITNPENIAIDITAYVTKSNGTLTVDTQPTSGDTLTIGEKTYIFTPVGTANAEGEISIGADLAGAQSAIVAAINGTDGHNSANSKVHASAFETNVCTITALVGGASGDLIDTTETFTATSNVFSGATLGSGADCSAANAVTALVGAITSFDTQGVIAVDGTGNTVELTSDVAGVIGNSITLSENMANGAFTGNAVSLIGGVDGTVGAIGNTMIDSNYVYRCISDNTTADKNWRRISLGSAY